MVYNGINSSDVVAIINVALDAEQAEREEYAKQNHEYLLQRDLFKQKLSALRKEREQLEDEIIKESKSTITIYVIFLLYMRWT